jgi:hypothetical protein
VAWLTALRNVGRREDIDQIVFPVEDAAVAVGPTFEALDAGFAVFLIEQGG